MSRFKILWIDDQPDKCRRAKRAVRQIIEEKGFEADIDLESDISTESLKNPGGILYKKIHGRDIDLFIIDYNLKNNVFGNSVISEIRSENEIYSDVVFYSSMRSELIETVKKSFDEADAVNYLDGVYIVPFDDYFNEKVDRIITKIIKSWFNIHSIRGVLLSKASKFEGMVGEIIKLGYHPCLTQIKGKLDEKGNNILSNATGCWKHVKNAEDPVPYVLSRPAFFNWAVKKAMLDEMVALEIINIQAEEELNHIFDLRNNFAHNPLHLEDGVLKLNTPDGIRRYTEEDVEQIREELVKVEKDLQSITEVLKKSISKGSLVSV